MRVVGEGGRCARCLCPSGACCVEEEVHKQVKPSRSIEHTFGANEVGVWRQFSNTTNQPPHVMRKEDSQTRPHCLQIVSQGYSQTALTRNSRHKKLRLGPSGTLKKSSLGVCAKKVKKLAGAAVLHA